MKNFKMNLFKNKKAKALTNTVIAFIAIGVIIVLIIIGIVLFKVLSGVLCPKCPECPECPAQIDPNDVQAIFNQITTVSTKLDNVNTQINLYKESCEINITPIKNEIFSISSQMQEKNNYTNSINTKFYDRK
ncbi:MAG: hypothetical protein QG646_4386 [Euryarchaeota archaeon]|nr:hypothetical protein [Euryarchaeota archaeon]